MPIGNLTSQIVANIYLNELDRFVKHELKAKAYLRYGDDFIIVEPSIQKLSSLRIRVIDFLQNTLKLSINPRSDIIMKSQQGLKYLGVIIWPSGRKLTKRNKERVHSRLSLTNAGSYWGMLKQHQKKDLKMFQWRLVEQLTYS